MRNGPGRNPPESSLLEVLKGRHTLHKHKAELLTDHQETSALMSPRGCGEKG